MIVFVSALRVSSGHLEREKSEISHLVVTHAIEVSTTKQILCFFIIIIIIIDLFSPLLQMFKDDTIYRFYTK